MSLAPGRFSSHRDTLTFVVCLLLSVVARLLPPAAQEQVASAIRDVGRPLLALQDRAVDLKLARTQHERLVAQRDSLFLEALAAQVLREENERLRELMGLARRVPVRHVAAQVLHQAEATDGFTLVLSAGRDRGVVAAAPVIAPGGLVGVVRTVDARTAVAMSWAHPDFRVSAASEGGDVFGIVAPHGSGGPNTMLLELRGVPYCQVVPAGTAVFTSGLGGTGGVYPRGIPIGVVVAVADERQGWSRTYVVRPAVHPGSLSHVLILTGAVVDVSAAFPATP